jgi:hypothetical protein
LEGRPISVFLEIGYRRFNQLIHFGAKCMIICN